MQVTGDTRTTDNWAATTTYTGIKIIPVLPEIQEETEISVDITYLEFEDFKVYISKKQQETICHINKLLPARTADITKGKQEVRMKS